MSHAQIALEMGVGRSTVSEALRRLGLADRKRTAVQTVAGRGLPFGKTVDQKALVDSTNETATIKIMKALRKEGLSYHAIARYLTETDTPTKTGKGKWAAATVMGILKRQR